ncbi:PREDICTED: voltage-dependent T-type calcium channel subunit alpha-1G-like isoform X2 [Lupinus angustifolius]|uniref:voltage-dependent T-type calcium channel subunit alpha-1G-like isoform X2 n=1 Tax=Lupinus angustifolius TaxID=3871 RepID=UPI00092F120C|nr:PREDICTED: voltage-dependent T-type calcium channel subunit alpha-1G-like isoform X2 [Lupinus angustifolius]
MGKPEDEQQPLPSGEDPPQNAVAECRCSWFRKVVGFRCILEILFSVAVFLSALFLLPPFLDLADQNNLHGDSRYKDHDIVASFIINKSVALLEDNAPQLAYEIFDEIEAPSTKVVILSLDPIHKSNMTKVVFAVDPDGKYSEMSSTDISLIRASFQSLVIRQSHLQLTSSSLFGKPSFFEVLKFKGGITIIPQQSAFPLQTVQTRFNFTLNFSIYQIQLNFNELTSQLKSGLELGSLENLQVILSNSEGSTVAPPTVVQSTVVLAVGINPTKKRMKQLAQTIMGRRNLGLNNTEFGRVKQVHLSSILNHSLHGNDGSGSAWSPAPAPLPHPPHHHHHHRHHHHHHHDGHLTPAVSPIPAPTTGAGGTSPEAGSPAATKHVPALGKRSRGQPPNCQFGHRRSSTHNAGKHAHQTPTVAPSIHPHYHVPVASPKPQVEPPAHVSHSIPSPVPDVSPRPHVELPARGFHSVPALSPLPNVAFAHAEPPPANPKNAPDGERSHTDFHGSSSVTCCVRTLKWASIMLIVLVLHV